LETIRKADTSQKKRARNLVLHLHPVKLRKEAIKFQLTFGLGGMSALLFLLQVFTGILLRFSYVASPMEAYDSILAIKNDISLYSMHTNLDIIKEGVSYRMADKLGLSNTEVMVSLGGSLLKLVVFVPLSHAGKVRQAVFEAGAGNIGNYDMCSFNLRGEGTFRGGSGSDPFAGEPGKEHVEEEVRIESVLPAHLKSRVVGAMIDSHPYEEVAYDLYPLQNRMPGAGLGCVGDLPESVTEKDMINMLSDIFGSECIRHSRLTGRKIKRVAVMGGSGGSYIGKAISSGAQAYVTADVKYHSFFEADKQILLADIGHYESEKPSLEILHELITKKLLLRNRRL